MDLSTKSANILIILTLQISSNIFAHSIKTTDSLELVAVLHRHGHRTPEHLYKNDPYKDEDKYWPIGLGQLTNKGKMQLFNLGKLFRKEYESFIDKYSVKAVRVNSSDYDRTHMSAQCLVAGWFPPSGDELWNEELIWQPVPIHSVPTNNDQILAPLAPCPRFWMEREKVMAEMASKETPEDKELYEYLSKHSGDNISTADDIAALYTNLQMEELNDLELPEWTKKVYPEKMQPKVDFCAKSFTWNKILKRFFGGPMVKEILHQFYEKSRGNNKNNKVFLYSAHDTTVYSFLRTLEFNDFEYPEFGASVIFELHRIYDKFVVKLFYSHAAELVPYELEIPNCPTPCPLEKILNITEYVRSVDWDTQCFK